MNLNVGNPPPQVGLHLHADQETQTQAKEAKIQYSSRAGQMQTSALDGRALSKLKARGVEKDDVISGASIRTLLKKSAGEMAARRWTNFLSVLPGNLRGSWSGSSHLREITNLAESYRSLPEGQLQLREETLHRLVDAMDRYGDSAARGRLQGRLTCLGAFVRGEIMEIQTRRNAPGLNDLPPTVIGGEGAIQKSRETFVAALTEGSSEALSKWAGDLGEEIGESLVKEGVDSGKFAGSSGRILKDEILKVLGESHPEVRQLCPNYDGAPPEVKEALDGLYTRLVNALDGSPGKKLGPGAMEFGGQVYTSLGGSENKETPVDEGGALLGQGGFAKVYVFQDSNGNEVVVKDAIVNSKEEVGNCSGETRREAEMHQQAGGAGHENIVGLKGSFFNGTGTTLCLEKCSGGNVDAFKNKISGALDNTGVLSHFETVQKTKVKDLVLATLTRDMARGLSHMHANGVAHLDFKGANIFLTTDGMAKIGDFGTAVKVENGIHRVPFKHTIPEALFYLSPEALDAKEQVIAVAGRIPGHLSISEVDLNQQQTRLEALGDKSVLLEFMAVKDELARVQQAFSEQGISTQARKALIAEWRLLTTSTNLALEMVQSEVGRDLGVTLQASKADVWALGMTLAEMAYYPNIAAGSPFVRNSQVNTGIAIQDYAKADPPMTYTEYRIQQWRLDHPEGEPPRNEALDALLDRMLHRDPEQRLTAEEVLQDPYITQAGVGDGKVRTFISTINDSRSTAEQATWACEQALML